MTEYQKMLNGEAFDGADPEICAVRDRAFDLQHRIAHCPRFELTQPLFRELLGQMGEGALVRTPFNCEFGRQIRLGQNTFINTGVVMLDGAAITLGNNVMVGPSVQFYTASHSLDHRQRRQWETHCRPITVEDDVWIGGNAVINGGVTIGARSVVAANSVVNQDVPPDCLVGGTPARMLKRLDT
ncbi:sugar O-acetyltransferase [Ferrimonas balearica]|uniref:sugar O-acetyltransferase n=1 Tax=Ferrimonas balearica TaxID=44012 RepID=UPI001C9972FE|nr:sugar O-acetyltransferase [Ferrimonas balearica]MBY5993870.1 sugar O-acetyltransferase [Ferrimonas balearica]